MNSKINEPAVTLQQQSLATIKSAGGLPEQFIQTAATKFQIDLRTRNYDQKGEKNRSITYHDALTRIDQPYKRVVDQNYWNESFRLSPKFSHYHKDQHTFRKSPRDLEMIKLQERNDSFKNETNLLFQNRKDSHNRNLARKLERFLIQHKSFQPLSDQKTQEMQDLQDKEPHLVEQLLMKKKWRNASKDPQKALQDQHLQTTDYWQQLNNLPQKAVDQIATKSIVVKDQESCNRLLEKILEQKQKEDCKKDLQMRDRALLRENLKQRHNQSLKLEERSGVRLGMSAKQVPAIANNSEMILQPADDKNHDQSQQESKIDQESIKRYQEIVRKSCFSESRNLDLKMKFTQPKIYKQTEHLNILAMPKPEYQGKDFFQRSEFRGLLLADYQEAIGDKAQECVDQLNKDTVSQFIKLKSFREALNQKKILETFYKTGLGRLNSFIDNTRTMSVGLSKTLMSDTHNMSPRAQTTEISKSIKQDHYGQGLQTAAPGKARVFAMSTVKIEEVPSIGAYWLPNKRTQSKKLETEAEQQKESIALFESKFFDVDSKRPFKFPNTELTRQAQKYPQAIFKTDKFINDQ